MEIRVSGHQVDTGAALQAHAEERLGGIVDKYFSQALSSQVTLGKAPHGGFRCDIVTHVMQGLILKGGAVAQEAHQALDAAAEKIDKQLRRYKRRLKDRHEQADAARRAEVDGYDAAALDNAGYTVFQADGSDEADVSEAPLVVAETRANIPETTVSDAVMMLDLRNTTALLFKNAGTGTHNMVYRREDGTIGWVEPAR